jgi:UDP-N-acetylmuramyl pentapeptide phosphotransferase/UDP-N-acetylglucosamine-1-phosphate transferase
LKKHEKITIDRIPTTIPPGARRGERESPRERLAKHAKTSQKPPIAPSPRRAIGPGMLIPALATLAVASVALGLLRWREASLPLAQPGPRSLHHAPIGRVGGLSIVAGVAVAVPAWPTPTGITPALAWAAAIAVAAVAAVSLADDWRGLTPATRLCVQALAAAAATWAMPLGLAWAALAVVAIVWTANLFNFMDGSDGLVAASAIAGFCAYALAAHAAGAPALPCATIALACVPFLFVNRPPARMFMGDVGAVTLGFLAATLGVAGVAGGAWPAWLPPLAFLPLLLDATATLARRAWRGERVWEAHNVHYYQRFHRMGAGHRGTFALYAALSCATAASAAACALRAPALGWPALAAWTIVIAFVFTAIDYHWRRRPGP